ncbi:vesicular glutamate transporter 2 isoform X6 [Cryptotermes secundus]|uniref:vesicular glutamate transporter 2 isoform X6 n=1 Tax=Cryptotermes secundus TaxID=105785 RepID=UPI000CD7AFE3|nr:vesicular glutamate transporter 2 isoform X6 [Cryptotermes secundus]
MEEAQRLDDEPMISKMYSACSFRRLQDMVPARAVLYFLSFSGFLVSFMMRTDINIAMIAMARLPPPSPYAANASSTPMYCYDPANMTDELAADNITKEEGEFDWDATTQSTILGSFYWCYILSQVVGGILTQHFGTKTVFGFSQFITAICSLLIPTAAPLHYGAVIALRSIQGIASGLTWPAMYAMVGHWIPAIERSRFMSSFQGFSFGIGLTYPLCGFLIAHFGWRVVFYVTGSVGILWCLIWWLLAFDTPAQHPRITPSERRYIESNVGNTVVGFGSSMAFHFDVTTSLVNWHHNIWTHLDSLYFHHSWAHVHEDCSWLQYSKEWLDVWSTIPVQLCFICPILLSGRCPCKQQASHPNQCSQAVYCHVPDCAWPLGAGYWLLGVQHHTSPYCLVLRCHPYYCFICWCYGQCCGHSSESCWSNSSLCSDNSHDCKFPLTNCCWNSVTRKCKSTAFLTLPDSLS